MGEVRKKRGGGVAQRSEPPSLLPKKLAIVSLTDQSVTTGIVRGRMRRTRRMIRRCYC